MTPAERAIDVLLIEDDPGDELITREAFEHNKIKNNLHVAHDGEEGLDFPACALVIRYDVNTTMIGYLQSRGRARQKTSEYVVLIDQYDPRQLEDYRVSTSHVR